VSVLASGRVVGLDLGSRRIGVAVSDSGRTLATPLATLERSGDPERDRTKIVELVTDEGATCVVVGMPLGLDGREGPAARGARDEARALAGALAPAGVPVVLFDERLTTVTADRLLAGSGLDGRRRRRVVDRSAATVLVQAFVDGRGDCGEVVEPAAG
jgi:putative Holliday junction resolvase